MNYRLFPQSMPCLRWNFPETVKARGFDVHSFEGSVVRSCVCVGVRYSARKVIPFYFSYSIIWECHWKKEYGWFECQPRKSCQIEIAISYHYDSISGPLEIY